MSIKAPGPVDVTGVKGVYPPPALNVAMAPVNSQGFSTSASGSLWGDSSASSTGSCGFEA